jgi:hypothetical protein
MSARGLLEELRAGGVRLQAEGLMLHIDAPAGVVTDELRATLRQNKRNLIRLLERERLRLEAADRRGLLIRWAREPGYVSIHDPTTGEWHELDASECPPWVLEAVRARRRFGEARR